ncbi:hypothetical protein GF338_05540 [candidate division WOR-3 bacterium]|nr:hypothetical protein [candidate division WOR-3 bacterium]
MKKILIASDLHARPDESLRTERFILFLRSEASTADRLYLLGDIFEFGFVFRGRILPAYQSLVDAICNLIDKGVKVFFLAGNHDIWMNEYLRIKGLRIITEDDVQMLYGRKVQFFHGILSEQDGLSKLASQIMKNPDAVWLYSRIPSSIGFGLALRLARISRKRNPAFALKFSVNRLKPVAADAEIVVSGHHHYPCEFIYDGVEYYIAGDWINQLTYLEMRQDGVVLRRYYS